jgi:hypothetical protein
MHQPADTLLYEAILVGWSVTYIGGAAAQAFQRRRYQLEDRFGDRITALNDLSRISEVVRLAEMAAMGKSARPKRDTPPTFFISYARSRPQEADFVEMLLRRRSFIVLRDEKNFGAGHSIPGEIRENIHGADVFVAIWCREYACSPWCYDELDLALERKTAGVLSWWILCVDDTRIVPPLARDLVTYPVRSREELEGLIARLLDQNQL